jgi:hypothetical protein
MALDWVLVLTTCVEVLITLLKRYRLIDVPCYEVCVGGEGGCEGGGGDRRVRDSI